MTDFYAAGTPNRRASFQPPSAWSTVAAVPVCACRVAQVCRRSCQRSPGSPARFRASLHTVLFDPHLAQANVSTVGDFALLCSTLTRLSTSLALWVRIPWSTPLIRFEFSSPSLDW